MTRTYILYFDDTGSRDPDRKYLATDWRADHMDCFGLGGILIDERDSEQIVQKHRTFCAEWDIDYPLHSSSIRGGRGRFGWLKSPERAMSFLLALEDFLLDLPIICVACVIDRCGYVARYRDRYPRLWLMCKTAFCILTERCAKFADERGANLVIFFEQSGKREDRDIVQYCRELKSSGNPFDRHTSSSYEPFAAEDYKRIVLGEPRRKTKNVPMMQIADLVLYPMAKGGYDPEYRPYKKLREAGKLIDCHLPEHRVLSRGIKYSCFDFPKD